MAHPLSHAFMSEKNLCRLVFFTKLNILNTFNWKITIIHVCCVQKVGKIRVDNKFTTPRKLWGKTKEVHSGPTLAIRSGKSHSVSFDALHIDFTSIRLMLPKTVGVLQLSLLIVGKTLYCHICRSHLCFQMLKLGWYPSEFPTVCRVLIAITAAGGSGKMSPVPNGCTGETLRNVWRKRARNFRN